MGRKTLSTILAFEYIIYGNKNVLYYVTQTNDKQWLKINTNIYLGNTLLAPIFPPSFLWFIFSSCLVKTSFLFYKIRFSKLSLKMLQNCGNTQKQSCRSSYNKLVGQYSQSSWQPKLNLIFFNSPHLFSGLCKNIILYRTLPNLRK